MFKNNRNLTCTTENWRTWHNFFFGLIRLVFTAITIFFVLMQLKTRVHLPVRNIFELSYWAIISVKLHDDHIMHCPSEKETFNTHTKTFYNK